MTAVLVSALIVRLYESVSWFIRTAATVSGWVLPVRVFVAITLSPGLSWLIAIAAPEASRTLVDVGEAQTAGCRRVLDKVVCVFWGKDALLRPAGPFEY